MLLQRSKKVGRYCHDSQISAKAGGFLFDKTMPKKRQSQKRRIALLSILNNHLTFHQKMKQKKN